MDEANPQSSPKLFFVTDYCDDIPRIRTFKKTLEPHTLRQIFPDPPIIAFRRNPSLRNTLARAKLKPINVDNTPTAEHTMERPTLSTFSHYKTTRIRSKDAKEHA